jgi:hypothetical protein
VTVHVLSIRDLYDEDLLGLYRDPHRARAVADKLYPGGAAWRPDPRGGEQRRLASGVYLRLRPWTVCA